MERKMIKKLLIIIMIITILAADFFVLGSGLITYAAQANNEIEGYPNIYFSTYFKEGENETKEINKSIKDKDLKLYVKIGVNSDVDYLEDISIDLKNSDFNIISSNKGNRKDNTVILDYIGAGTAIEVELNIEPILANKIAADMLLKTDIELNATYKHAKAPNGEKINATSKVAVKYKPDETTESELLTDIITNKVFSVNGTNKRIVQLLIKSRLTNNEFPVKQTKLNVTIPKLGENTPEVNVLAIGELATNGENKISNITTKNSELEIILNNEIDSNNQINWSKNVYDELVVTYVYPETVDANLLEIITNSEITLHSIGTKYTAKYKKGIENQERNSVLIGKTEITTKELYKGQLYANIETQYDSKTSIVVTSTNIVDEIVVHENTDIFGTTGEDLPTNSRFIKTEINLNEMLAILGQDGNIQVKTNKTVYKIDKSSKVNENGNIVIEHENEVNELDIITSKPVEAGVLEIKHTKSIIGNSYTREQIKTVETLKTTGLIKGTNTVNKEKEEVISKATETTSLQLKETISKAELTIDRTSLSATEVNEVTLGIKLITDGSQYDLYKNPSLTIKFPDAVENVEFVEELSKLYADEFTITNKNYDSSQKTLRIDMAGEQRLYPESSLTQAYIQLKLKVKLEPLTLAKTDKIIMAYVNENASQYENGNTYGIVEQTIGISAPSQLIKMFNVSSNENISTTEKILEEVKAEYKGKELNFDIALINNKDSNMSNVNILGKLPTTGNTLTGEEENTLVTTLKNITATNATIYYTENASATENVEDISNGWTQDLASLSNAKLYLIKLDKIARGSKYVATVKVQVPETFTGKEMSYTQYEVIYDTDTETKTREQSRKIGLITSTVASIKIETNAQVGEDILNNRDTVKEGEVIKYTVTVKNKGVQTLNDVKLKLDIPEGTVYVRPIQKYVFGDGTGAEDVINTGGYVYAEGKYYEEITDSAKLTKLTNITINELPVNYVYTIEYEVRVNKGTAGNEISNIAQVKYIDSTIESEEIRNTIEQSNVRVTIKRAIDVSAQLLPNAEAEYVAYVENLSDSTIKDLEIKIVDKGIALKTSETIKIDEIKPRNENDKENYENGMKIIAIKGIIEKDAKEISICALVNDSEGKTYRSNFVSEKLPHVDATVNLSSPQNGADIKDGDIVEYNITVQNTGEVESLIQIIDKVSEYLQVQSIYVNKELKVQRTAETPISNNINYPLVLKPQEQAQIDIITKAGFIPKLYNGKTITNMVNVKIADVAEVNSQIITHILKANVPQEENIKNVISGLAWFDENENGEKDANENVLTGITVKLFDTVNNCYATNSEGNAIEAKTDNNGEYKFTKIENGSYLIIFEYDTEKYEFTKGYAEGVDTSLNSKVSLKNIKLGDKQIRVAAIELSNLNDNVFNMNIGLKKNTGKTPIEEQPGIEDPEQKEEIKEKQTISGFAWLDLNRNGRKDEDETMMEGIRVRLYNVSSQKIVVDTETKANGEYKFVNVEKGEYIIVFLYNTDEYEPTTYLAEGVPETQNSNVILKKVTVNGQEILAAVTDRINLQKDISNINIGLKEDLIFDLELNKYISRIIVQTSEKTKQYDYVDDTFEKVEIHRKQIVGSMVVLEYTIKVKNNGEIAGYAKNIVDYLPSGLTFSSELNKEWYLSGNYLYTKSLENVELQPGEEKEVKLVLTKTMTNNNLGLINNRAEIYEDYNKYGETDIDSIPNNQVQDEDDFGSVDVIIQVATGGSNTAYIILLIINMILIGFAIKLMIRTRIIKRPTMRKRR